MRIGIVGHEAAKFTASTESAARAIIRGLLDESGAVLVSGRCHLGGVDIYAEEEADRAGLRKLIFPPLARNWQDGYKPRNILIAANSDVVHVIVVRELPAGYKGMRFDGCYHCRTSSHVKSGGCWTAKYALSIGKPARTWEL